MTPPEPRPAAVPDPNGSAPARSAPGQDNSEAPAANQLTPEEQMALFEKELKETDWGHQPC